MYVTDDNHALPPSSDQVTYQTGRIVRVQRASRTEGNFYRDYGRGHVEFCDTDRNRYWIRLSHHEEVEVTRPVYQFTAREGHQIALIYLHGRRLALVNRTTGKFCYLWLEPLPVWGIRLGLIFLYFPISLWTVMLFDLAPAAIMLVWLAFYFGHRAIYMYWKRTRVEARNKKRREATWPVIKHFMTHRPSQVGHSRPRGGAPA